MSIACATVAAPGPIGALTVAVGDAGTVLVRFGDDRAGVVAAAARLGEEVVADGRTDEVAGQLAGYLAGGRRSFTVPLDWRLASRGALPVLRTLHASVPFGATVGYGELAARSGLGSAYTAARAVGAIMGANPLPVLVPCHRVVAADGLGGFGGGRAAKEWLLALEGAATAPLFG